MHKFYNIILKILVFFLLITCLDRSFGEEIVFFPNLADEIITISIILVCFLNNSLLRLESNRAIRQGWIAYFLFVILGVVFGIIYSQNSSESVFADFIEYSKPLVFFILLTSIKFKGDFLKFMEKSYLLLNIPSMLAGVVQWFSAQYLNLYIGGVSPYRERWMGVRITGLAGHNISMGAAMMVTIIILLNKRDRGFFSYLMLIFSSICLLLTQSRLPIALTILYVFYKMFAKKIINYSSKYVLNILLLFSCLFVLALNFALSSSKHNQLAEEEEATIRMTTMKIGVSTMLSNSLFGKGFGAYGSVESVKNNSPIYRESSDGVYARSIVSGGAQREAYFFDVMITSGLIGIFLFYFYFISTSVKLAKQGCYTGYYLIFFGIVIQSFMNHVVQMPTYYFACLYCASYLNYK